MLRTFRLASLVVAFLLGCPSSAPPADEEPDADSDSDTDADTDTDSDSDTDADTDTDSDTDADTDTDSNTDTDTAVPDECTIACTFGSECGAPEDRIDECHGACDRGELPRSLAECMAQAAHDADCESWRGCFEPVDDGFCEPWCAFAGQCEFLEVEQCRNDCEDEPPPVAIADCLEEARLADSCEEAALCFFDPLPDGFCEDLCARADECGFVEDIGFEGCLDTCGPVAPPALVDCVAEALEGSCRDLANCFGGEGPSAEQCADVCELRAECADFTEEQLRECEEQCLDHDPLGFAPCIQSAVDQSDCAAADACFGELNVPPEGHCNRACSFELDPCALITEKEVATCIELCNAGGQRDEFYACREQAVDDTDCEAYLGCAP